MAKLRSADYVSFLSKKFPLPNLSYIAERLPIFFVYSNQINFLQKPQQFYEQLLKHATNAKKRIIMSSLYIGTGHLEQKLVTAIKLNGSSTKDLRIQWLLDHTRASRGTNSSRSMLLPLLNENVHSNSKVSLFHSPYLRGLTRLVLPERWNEVVALQHMKVYVFDDSVIVSGANLSNDYFTNRQDRYVLIENCPNLADFYEGLIGVICKHSLQLDTNNRTAMSSPHLTHPYKGDFSSYCEEFGQSFEKFWRNECRKSNERLRGYFSSSHGSNASLNGSNASLNDAVTSLNGSNTPLNGCNTSSNGCNASLDDAVTSQSVPDTLLSPTVQIPHCRLDLDSSFTLGLLRSAQEGSSIKLATGYFNLTEQYMKSILTKALNNTQILCAHPKANGFLGAPGFAGGIPAAYTRLCSQFYERVLGRGMQKSVRIFEYLNPGWTFHAKGLWLSTPGQAEPSTTLIGSPNFGYRSVYRDLETQLIVSTHSPKLKEKLRFETEYLFGNSSEVCRSTFEEPDRAVPLWVKLFTIFFKFYF